MVRQPAGRACAGRGVGVREPGTTIRDIAIAGLGTALGRSRSDRWSGRDRATAAHEAQGAADGQAPEDRRQEPERPGPVGG
jgi:hypothetical protein